jgi:hypothetical protein
MVVDVLSRLQCIVFSGVSQKTLRQRPDNPALRSLLRARPNRDNRVSTSQHDAAVAANVDRSV